MNKALRALSVRVSGSYPDFVRAMQDLARIHGIEDALIAFMRDNPDATTSDVLGYEGELSGTTEPLEIIDD